jgi:uncharacterized protein (TIGR02217 family)
MTAFPSLDSISIISPLGLGMEFKTLISKFDNGSEVRKAKWTYGRRNLRVGYQYKDLDDARTLWQFYQARKGSYQAFNFFLAHSDTYTGEYVGEGDGSTTVFNLPSKSASSYTLYKNGAAQSAGGVDYTFAAQGGTDNADKITMTAAPDDGDILTFDFTGYLKIRCRFAEDIQDFDVFFRMLTHMDIKMKGLLNV